MLKCSRSCKSFKFLLVHEVETAWTNTFFKSHFPSLLGFILVYSGVEGDKQEMLFASTNLKKKPERVFYPIPTMLSGLFFL